MKKSLISDLAARKLKELRVSHGYKVHDMAIKLNKSDQQLFRYEKGVNKIDLDTIINYLEVLQIDINHFFSELNSEIKRIKNQSERNEYLVNDFFQVELSH
ncbi:helix-turn-helix domain-containing protein [Providencia sp. PROV116]|uniref:helix-turn-helix domain-containing protein n=1 Tax=Providencia sp. PROV116 TaxID=2949827 RepID=UPI00234BAEE7|nr:helix-turn-helix transcriptional regulator [Providencia sp. PROV116]